MRVVESGIGELIQPPDMNAFREWNRTQKSRKLVDKLMTEQEAVSRFVYDGCYIGTELYGTVRCPMSLVREVLRQGIKDLRVAGQGVTELDLWLGAGLVKKLDLTYIGLEVYGTSRALRRAVESGQVESVVEWSNGGITWRFKAAAMGVPFIPVRAMLGSDTFRYSAAKVVECPFTGQKICLLPALILDVARALTTAGFGALAIANAHLDPNRLVIIAVGDRSRIEPELASLGRGTPVVWSGDF